MKERLKDWPLRLSKAVAARQSTVLAWGSHDCCAFARFAVQEMTGEDPMPQVPAYSNVRQAQQILKSLGGCEAIPDAAGLAEIPLRMAQRGDVVSCQSGRRISLGICLGTRSVFATKGGLSFPPTLTCLRAWRI